MRLDALFVACAIAVAFVGVPAHAMTVAEAYAAIPHHRTPYDATRSALPRPTAESLGALFTLVDRAVVLRVTAMRAIESGTPAGAGLRDYDAILGDMGRLPLGADVAPIRDLILAAIREQRSYLEGEAARPAAARRLALASVAPVRESSARLQRAYGLLMERFGRETGPNKAAFFDHLCALDFL